tara:strand:- start:893 stop:1135 length:243 start_codon:yes stop_codon:yes gene_type:complete
MKVVEIEEEDRITEKHDRACHYLERFVCWLLITTAVAMCLTLVWETRQTMHIHNKRLEQNLIMQTVYQHPRSRPADYFMP